MVKQVFMKSMLIFGLALFLFTPVAMAKDTIKIAFIESLTGPLETYGKQGQIGFQLGMEYATNGTMELLGKKIEITNMDSKTQPAEAKQLLINAYKDLDVDIAVGPTSSACAMAMLPVAAEFKKLLVVSTAVSQAIVGPKGNRYIYKVSRSSSHDALAGAIALVKGKKDVYIATLAQDYAYGIGYVNAFEKAVKEAGGKIIHKEFVPMKTQDFTAPGLRIVKAFKDVPEGATKYLVLNWAGKGSPLNKLKSMQLESKHGITLSSGGNIIPVLKAYKNKFDGGEGAAYYYYKMHDNEQNKWLIKKFAEKYDDIPDFFHCGGFAAAMAVVEGIKKAGSAETEAMVTAMKGMEFMTPKGKMKFQECDNQALQSMFHFKFKSYPEIDHIVPELIRELTIEDLPLPCGR